MAISIAFGSDFAGFKVPEAKKSTILYGGRRLLPKQGQDSENVFRANF